MTSNKACCSEEGKDALLAVMLLRSTRDCLVFKWYRR